MQSYHFRHQLTRQKRLANASFNNHGCILKFCVYQQAYLCLSNLPRFFLNAGPDLPFLFLLPIFFPPFLGRLRSLIHRSRDISHWSCFTEALSLLAKASVVPAVLRPVPALASRMAAKSSAATKSLPLALNKSRLRFFLLLLGWAPKAKSKSSISSSTALFLDLDLLGGGALGSSSSSSSPSSSSSSIKNYDTLEVIIINKLISR